MNTGYAIIAIGFLAIAILISWTYIERKKIFIKAALILIVIWYAVAIQYALPRFAGWPTQQDIPDDSIVMSVVINEPRNEDKGGIYLWLTNLKKEESKTIDLDPRTVFGYISNREPRAYGVPYSRELHKRIRKAQQRAERESGIMKLKGKDSKRKAKGEKGTQGGFIGIEIINPTTILKKDAG